MGRLKNGARIVVPWLIAFLILTHLFMEYSPRAVWEMFRRSNMLYLIIVSAAYFVSVYLADVISMQMVLKRFGFHTPLGTLLAARGTTYLVMNINYPASQAAFAYYLKKKAGVPIRETMGIFMFIGAIDFYILFSLASIGSLLQEISIGGMELGGVVRGLTISLYTLAILIYVIFKWDNAPRWMKRLTNFRVFMVLREASLKDYINITIYRVPLYICILFAFHLGIKAYHADVSFRHIFATIPLAYLIGIIPITPSGLGTTNYTITQLLLPYTTCKGTCIGGAGSLLFSATVTWMVINLALKALTGLVWLASSHKIRNRG